MAGRRVIEFRSNNMEICYFPYTSNLKDYNPEKFLIIYQDMIF